MLVGPHWRCAQPQILFYSRLLLLPAEDGQQHDYPAYAAAFFPDCILAVAAIGQDNDKLTDFSNYGQLVRIAAPVSRVRGSAAAAVV